MRGRFAAAVCSMMLLTACGIPLPSHSEPSEPGLSDTADAADFPADNEQPESSVTETETAAPILLSADNRIADRCSVLDADTLAYYHAHLTNLADTHQICTAVVITNTLDGQTPEQFAAACYHEAFGTDTNGFLLLINNETGEDVYYLEGTCAEHRDETALPLAQATPHLVEGDYPAALDILLAVE